MLSSSELDVQNNHFPNFILSQKICLVYVNFISHYLIIQKKIKAELDTNKCIVNGKKTAFVN